MVEKQLKLFDSTQNLQTLHVIISAAMFSKLQEERGSLHLNVSDWGFKEFQIIRKVPDTWWFPGDLKILLAAGRSPA
jgi:hypothetical protein